MLRRKSPQEDPSRSDNTQEVRETEGSA
jgi:hypothetical protein